MVVFLKMQLDGHTQSDARAAGGDSYDFDPA
jgi:hypothetical protein